MLQVARKFRDHLRDPGFRCFVLMSVIMTGCRVQGQDLEFRRSHSVNPGEACVFRGFFDLEHFSTCRV